MKLTSSNAELDRKLIRHGEGEVDLLNGIYFIEELLLAVLRIEMNGFGPAEDTPVDKDVKEEGFLTIPLFTFCCCYTCC